MPRARNRQLLESSRRRQEERRRLVWLWRAAALVALIVLGLAFLNQPSGQWREVMITGARLVPVAEVRAAVERGLAGRYAWLVPRRQVWFFPRRALREKLLAEFPILAVVTFSGRDSVLAVNLIERTPALLWCDGADRWRCYLADASGRLFAPAPEFSEAVFPVWQTPLAAAPLGSRPLAPELFARLNDFQTRLMEVLAGAKLSSPAPTRVGAGEQGDFVFWFGELKVLINAEADLNQALANLRAALGAPTFVKELAKPNQQLEYLDLRFPPKVFYKF